MEKLNGTSMDLIQENVKKLKEIFPEIFIEGRIDFDLLRQICHGGGVQDLEDSKERYSLTWNGKSRARQIAQEVSTGTLRPAKEESKNWDNTENIYIEGDNLEVLKLLQKSYHGKIKMIYIDPPYNTGKDFVYKDNFRDNIENYKKVTGQISEEGIKLTTNTETNGRYHSDWLNMMYPRLKLARNLLTDDGVIFISIDDNEQANLKKICDEIFGEENFIGELSWLKKRKGSFLSQKVVNVTEYVIIYAMKSNLVKLYGGKPDENESQPLIKRTNSFGKLKFPPCSIYTKLKDGIYKKGTYGVGTSSVNLLNDIEVKNELITTELVIEAPFIWSQSLVDEQIKLGAKFIINTINFQIRVFKIYEEEAFKGLSSIINGVELRATNEDGYTELVNILNAEKILDYPKPINLLKYLVNSSTYFKKSSVILDFFSGSSTTAHSVMQLNVEDGGNRKYIMVQLPEICDENSEAYKAGYKNICEIGKERIRRAGEKIKSDESLPLENREKLDVGFKVFKLDSTNIKEWYTDTEDLQQTLLDSMENIKSDRNSLDVLYEILLKYGLDLNIPIEENKDFYSIGGGSLLVSLNKEINDEVIDSICKEYKNLLEIDKDFKTTVILRDNSFKNDVDKTNAIKKLEQVGINEIRSI